MLVNIVTSALTGSMSELLFEEKIKWQVKMKAFYFIFTSQGTVKHLFYVYINDYHSIK